MNCQTGKNSWEVPEGFATISDTIQKITKSYNTFQAWMGQQFKSSDYNNDQVGK